jgi:MFS family permease
MTIRTPISKLQVLCLSIMLLCEGYNSTFLYSFIGYMIVDFGLIENEADAGYYAGFIAASYSITQLFSGILFGIAGDARWLSKKTILLTGTIGTSIFTLAFGFSPNLYFALSFRLLTGLFNGNIATAKSYMSDITDKTNQNMAFSIMGMFWCSGCVLGPAVGGLLARPAHQYSLSLFKLWIFIKFPYLLPCVFCFLLMVIAFAIAFFALKKNPPEDKILHEDLQVESYGSLNTTTSENRTPYDGIHKISRNQIIRFQLTMLWNNMRSFFRKEVIIVMLAFTIVAMFEISQNELFPLWSMLSGPQGGLQFSTTQTGIYQCITGAWMILAQGLLYPYLATKLGKIKCARIGCLMIIPLAFTPQLSYLLHFHKSILWIFLCIYSLFRAISSVFYFSSLVILINNSAPYGKSGLYASVSQSCICFSKTVTPIIVGYTFAFTSRLRHPLRLNITFFFYCSLMLFTFVTTFMLSPKLNTPKPIPKEVKQQLIAKQAIMDASSP